MNKILIDKLKKALETSHPLEAVKEIIDEYDEIYKLAEWRKKILKSGDKIEKHRKELNRIKKILEDSGYYMEFTIDELDEEIREYFRKKT